MQTAYQVLSTFVAQLSRLSLFDERRRENKSEFEVVECLLF